MIAVLAAGTLAPLGCARRPAAPPRSAVGDWVSVSGQAGLQLSLYEDGTGTAYAWSTAHPDDRIPMDITSWSIAPDRGTISIKVVNPGASEEREIGGSYEWLGERLAVDHVSEEGALETRTYARIPTGGTEGSGR